MRKPITAALCTLMAWGPVAFAQEEADVAGDETQEGGENDAAEVNGLEVAPPQRQGTRVRTAEGNASAPGQVHTVVKGDTLWDLSQSYLGSPWYWPKVWSYNPEIANPHWIYPGNKVRFFATGEEVPSRVEIGNAPIELAEDVDAPALMEGGDEGRVEVAGQIGYQPKSEVGAAGQMRLQGFVTSRELDEAGQIRGSFAESLMLSYPDTVYLQFKNKGDVRVGSDYLIFRTVKKVEHPVTRNDLGYLTHFLGKAKVIKTGNGLVTAQITESWDEINRGDLVGPASEDLMVHLTPRPNTCDLKGYVVEPMVPYQTLLGEHQLVLVDKGSADGVQVGNTFTVVRQEDSGGNNVYGKHEMDERWPIESIATCLVVDVKDKASACALTRSIREVLPGDRVVMQPAGSAPAAALSVR